VNIAELTLVLSKVSQQPPSTTEFSQHLLSGCPHDTTTGPPYISTCCRRLTVGWSLCCLHRQRATVSRILSSAVLLSCQYQFIRSEQSCFSALFRLADSSKPIWLKSLKVSSLNFLAWRLAWRMTTRQVGGVLAGSRSLAATKLRYLTSRFLGDPKHCPIQLPIML
jgi:hypothetical protein